MNTKDVCLSGCGQHFARPDPGMFKVNHRLYELSRQMKRFHSFLSHDWSTSRWMKLMFLGTIGKDMVLERVILLNLDPQILQYSMWNALQDPRFLWFPQFLLYLKVSQVSIVSMVSKVSTFSMFFMVSMVSKAFPQFPSFRRFSVGWGLCRVGLVYIQVGCRVYFRPLQGLFGVGWGLVTVGLGLIHNWFRVVDLGLFLGLFKVGYGLIYVRLICRLSRVCLGLVCWFSYFSFSVGLQFACGWCVWVCLRIALVFVTVIVVMVAAVHAGSPTPTPNKF